ncbi:RNA polymerase sigma factor [Maribacter sp. HTCC2170]|uniref:RNA polymerase sigma factor n=1 Tax=Maribacter sp. (strain HTCC2170 / KCCM 42371) TaxID=313603 RepID=UPI00006BD300|nr:RNA polymerase sigma factor [Maribacter sp. HTCC2170]EAR02568.1 putative RNA polymerase ECF-type sigma factor [Maribacter sp. HTCC2170]
MSEKTDNYNNLNTFFNEEYHSLKAYARSKIDNAADRDAEDIVQEVALKLFARADSTSPINNIAGFVYNSLKNKIIDILRTKRERVEIVKELESKLIEFTELLYGASDNNYSDSLKSELKTAIINLKPLYKNVILAIDFEGFTYREVSFETGIPIGTLMSRRHRAIAILYNELNTKRNIN